jgi:glycerophosphoryl diester phosphodiesterase
MTRPLLLGHRGARASRNLPENTLASFELCLEHGCDGFEFDVRRSQEGVAVICHDPTVGKLQIEHSSSKALGLPALVQVLQQFSSRAFLDIELKVAGLEEQLIEALREYSPRNGYVFSSFLPEALMAIHQLDDTIPLGFICDRRSHVSPPALPLGWMIPNVELVSRELVEEVHASAQKMMVWTVNRADQMQQLAAWGVDAIISDETELLARSFR